MNPAPSISVLTALPGSFRYQDETQPDDTLRPIDHRSGDGLHRCQRRRRDIETAPGQLDHAFADAGVIDIVPDELTLTRVDIGRRIGEVEELEIDDPGVGENAYGFPVHGFPMFFTPWHAPISRAPSSAI